MQVKCFLYFSVPPSKGRVPQGFCCLFFIKNYSHRFFLLILLGNEGWSPLAYHLAGITSPII